VPLKLALVTAIGLASVSAHADTLSSSPPRLEMSATRGEAITRSISIPSSTGAWEIAFPPLSTANGESQITSVSAKETAANGVRIVEFSIDLAGVDHGEYATELVVKDAGGDSATVPVEVSVKSSRPLPITLLVGGIAIGLLLSRYRTSRRERDEIVIRLASLMSRIDTARPPDVFAKELNAQIVRIRDAMARQAWTDANTALDAGTALLARFSAYEADWRALLAHIAELRAAASHVNATDTATYRKALLDALEDLADSATTLDSPRSLRETARVWRKRIERYLTLESLLTEDKPEIRAFRKRLDRLAVEDDTSAEELHAEIDKALGAGDAALDAPTSTISPTPAATSVDPRGAIKRLAVYKLALIVLGAMSLGFLGYHQLYESNATFGSFWDYVTILMWGLGTEIGAEAAHGKTTDR
jgi:hypothetical protein